MKIRIGFVSNSSTTSFCIYGTIVSPDAEDIIRLLKLTEKDRNPEYENLIDQIEADWDTYYYELEDVIDSDKELESHYPDWADGLYVGRAWCTIRDDETGKQFKENTEKRLKEIFGDKIKKLEILEEAWRDG